MPELSSEIKLRLPSKIESYYGYDSIGTRFFVIKGL